jgi:hypothetical protein
MNAFRLMPSLILLLTIQAHAIATDLKRIDRSIGKEPAYESKPKYCLVVFDPEATSRVWLVVDGNSLFTSGRNGELTKHGLSGSRFTVRVPGTSQDLTVQVVRRDDKPVGVTVQCDLKLELARRQTMEGMAQLGDSPKSAPVIHLDGSYTSTLRERGVIQKGQWVRDAGENASLDVYIGSNVLQDQGKGFLRTWWTFPADKIRPVADVEFPNQDTKAEPLKFRVTLIHR